MVFRAMVRSVARTRRPGARAAASGMLGALPASTAPVALYRVLSSTDLATPASGVRLIVLRTLARLL